PTIPPLTSPPPLFPTRRSSDLQAIGASFKSMKPGMTNQELSANVGAATKKRGGNGDGALVIFGKYTAFPHGSIQPQKLRGGDVRSEENTAELQSQSNLVCRLLL